MSDRVHLFLADHATGEPVLPGGIAPEVAREAARGLGVEARAAALPAGDVLADMGADPGALDRQRWGIVAPRGERGRDLLAAVERLRKRRAEEQGEEPVVYEVPPDMTAVQTAEWLRTEYVGAVSGRIERLPRFLLLLGGPEDVSWAAQQQMASVAMPGRLSFHLADGAPDLEGYELYSSKVLRWEDAERRDAVVLFYTVRSGQDTEDGNAGLVLPNLLALRGAGGGVTARDFGVSAPRPSCGSELLAPAAEVRAAAREETAILFSFSHGVGGRWGSPAEQRAGQGAPKWGDRLLTVEDVATGPFLPGGAWILYACYGAGTPRDSLYARWVERVPDLRAWMGSGSFRACQPMDGVPFVAAVPEAALRNDKGPLAVVGHVDLAMSASFSDVIPDRGQSEKRTYPERFTGALRSFSLGRRAGVAFDDLARGAREIDAELAAHEDAAVQAGSAAGGDDAAALVAARWLQRQDLRSFVLLGDPAARVRVAEAGPKAKGQISLPAMEQAVIQRLKGGALPDIARRLGVKEGDVARWVERYQAAGREALSKMR